MQIKLDKNQLLAFHHDDFVEDQINDFMEFTRAHTDLNISDLNSILDIGGGIGNFANALKKKISASVCVLETDLNSIKVCKARGLDAKFGDATNYFPAEYEKIACFNLVLHHLVAANLSDTYHLQKNTLENWRIKDKVVFVNEYIYESFIPGFSGWIIYVITSSKFLSMLCRSIAKYIPVFRANTFGVGVRFRSNKEWIHLFNKAGFDKIFCIQGRDEHISFALRILFIKNIRRNSYCMYLK